jgi:hypothetical protein
LWDWGFQPGVVDDSGRTRSTVNWLEHSDKALTEVLRLVQDLSRFLTLPNSTRARHRVTYFGRKEALRTNQVGFELFESSLVHLGKLSALCEILKREGLPPNEATRVRQVRCDLCKPTKGACQASHLEPRNDSVGAFGSGRYGED